MLGSLLFLALTCNALAAPLEDDALQEFIQGHHKFTAAVYKELVKQQSGNIIVSPFSTETLLTLTYEGAHGATASELLAGLDLPSTEEKIQEAFQSLTGQFQVSGDDIKLLSANRIFVQNDVKLNDTFKGVAETIYGSGIENVDFSENAKTAKEINDWVEDNTNNKIHDLIDPSSIGVGTRMVLVNTMYFYGKWESMFEEHGTIKRTFYKTKEESVEIDTMQQTANLQYYENSDLDAKFLQLSYQGDDITMVIVVPNDIEGLTSLEENLEEVIESQPFYTEYLAVYLPKFVIETEISFVPILKALGIHTVFEERANLTGFTSVAQNLYISGVTQKAYINITEGGTEAAGGSADVIPEPLPVPPGPDPIELRADRPFLYVIKKKDVIPFIGRFMGPS